MVKLHKYKGNKMIRQFEFSLSTNKYGSEVREIVDYNMEDFVYEGISEEDFEEMVRQDYEEWVWQHNYGGYEEIE